MTTQLVEFFAQRATGKLRDLTIQVVQNPAMPYFLEAQNIKASAPSESDGIVTAAVLFFILFVGQVAPQALIAVFLRNRAAALRWGVG